MLRKTVAASGVAAWFWPASARGDFVARALCALGLDRALAGLALGRQLAAAVAAGDDLVGRLVLGDEARLHAEVDRLGVVGDDCNRRLFGHHGVAVGEGHPDLLEVEQAPDLLVL